MDTEKVSRELLELLVARAKKEDLREPLCRRLGDLGVTAGTLGVLAKEVDPRKA